MAYIADINSCHHNFFKLDLLSQSPKVQKYFQVSHIIEAPLVCLNLRTVDFLLKNIPVNKTI